MVYADPSLLRINDPSRWPAALQVNEMAMIVKETPLALRVHFGLHKFICEN